MVVHGPRADEGLHRVAHHAGVRVHPGVEVGAEDADRLLAHGLSLGTAWHTCLFKHIYIYIYIYIHTHISIYLYLSLSLYIYIYICI